MTNKTYLGDGVYAHFDKPGRLVLTTEYGDRTIDKIYLDPEVLENLLLYLRTQAGIKT